MFFQYDRHPGDFFLDGFGCSVGFAEENGGSVQVVSGIYKGLNGLGGGLIH